MLCSQIINSLTDQIDGTIELNRMAMSLKSSSKKLSINSFTNLGLFSLFNAVKPCLHIRKPKKLYYSETSIF
jgi:hypothetical protein